MTPVIESSNAATYLPDTETKRNGTNGKSLQTHSTSDAAADKSTKTRFAEAILDQNVKKKIQWIAGQEDKRSTCRRADRGEGEDGKRGRAGEAWSFKTSCASTGSSFMGARETTRERVGRIAGGVPLARPGPVSLGPLFPPTGPH